VKNQADIIIIEHTGFDDDILAITKALVYLTNFPKKSRGKI